MRFFQKHRQKKLFSLTDLLQMTGERRTSLLVQLSRLNKEGLVERVSQGWYANPFSPPTPEEAAMVIRYASYLSLEYALSRSGLLNGLHAHPCHHKTPAGLPD